MYSALHQYLIRFKELSLPGIGTISLQTTSARGDFAARLIHAPVQQISWKAEATDHPAHFYPWLAALMQIPAGEAINQFHDFCSQLKEQVYAGAKIDWKGVGVITKGAGRTIRFEPAVSTPVETAVTAEKIIREKAEHDVRVGEEKRTADEMRAYLNPEKATPSRWWIAALVLGLLAVMFTGWHLSEKGLGLEATSCTQPVVPMETTAP